MKKRILIGLILTVMLLCTASPVLALSLGASPTRVEFEVPGSGSTTIDIQIHYFDGDVQISLIDIPLRIEPEVISVKASENPVKVQLTVYGDESLGSKTYNGYIRLIAISDGAATGGVQIITKATNMVDGVPMETIVEPAPSVTAPDPVIVPNPVVEPDPVITPSKEYTQVPPEAPIVVVASSQNITFIQSLAIAAGAIIGGFMLVIIIMVLRSRRRKQL